MLFNRHGACSTSATMMKIGFWSALVGSSFLVSIFGRAEEGREFVQPTSEHPLIVKVVVLAMFEVGADTGDKPGEYQFWVERRKLDHIIPLPAAYHDVRTDDKGVIATVTGMGTAHAAASVTALGLDPRFDFSRAYWVIAGIAGVNPNRASIGSAIWADYVLDGDLAHEIDAREIPKNWSTGLIPIEGAMPFPKPRPRSDGEVYELNSGLVQWAYDLTREIPLQDTETMKKSRIRYKGFQAALAGPKVLKGATLSSSTYWHGKILNRWASDWVNYWTDGKGAYFTTAMEDSGTMQALSDLAKAGRADLKRVLVLRTASNFDSQPSGITAAEDLAEEHRGDYSAYIPSLEAAFDVGNRVVTELSDHWDLYATKRPDEGTR
jgi:purine nucleoside permease